MKGHFIGLKERNRFGLFGLSALCGLNSNKNRSLAPFWLAERGSCPVIGVEESLASRTRAGLKLSPPHTVKSVHEKTFFHFSKFLN